MLPRPTAPKPVRRRDKGTRTRAEIVAAAETQFATRGYEATRLEDIATQVGIRRAAIFYHFGDKQELYTEVLDDIFGDWTAALPTGGGAAERLEASLVSWIDYIARRPSVARLILREAANAQPGTVSQFVRSGSATITWFRSVIDEGMASGELKPIIEPYRFMSLTGAMTVFHFAAIPWLTLGGAIYPWRQDEIEQHKREVLLVARTMLGIESSAGGSG